MITQLFIYYYLNIIVIIRFLKYFNHQSIKYSWFGKTKDILTKTQIFSVHNFNTNSRHSQVCKLQNSSQPTYKNHILTNTNIFFCQFLKINFTDQTDQRHSHQNDMLIRFIMLTFMTFISWRLKGMRIQQRRGKKKQGGSFFCGLSRSLLARDFSKSTILRLSLSTLQELWFNVSLNVSIRCNIDAFGKSRKKTLLKLD